MDDQPFRNEYCLFVRFDGDGKIIQVIEMVDSGLFLPYRSLNLRCREADIDLQPTSATLSPESAMSPSIFEGLIGLCVSS